MNFNIRGKEAVVTSIVVEVGVCFGKGDLGAANANGISLAKLKIGGVDAWRGSMVIAFFSKTDASTIKVGNVNM